MRRSAAANYTVGHGAAPKRAPSAKRAQTALSALKREGQQAANVCNEKLLAPVEFIKTGFSALDELLCGGRG